MKPKQLKPITLELRLSYTFDPVDYLPDDWQGTRKKAIEWFRSDIVENIYDWINPRDIYDCIKEEKPDLTPELLSALRLMLTREMPPEGSLEWKIENGRRMQARAAIAKAEENL